MKIEICQTCLCNDRLLFSFKEVASSLKYVNILPKKDHQRYPTGICWECKAIIMKFSRFKKQVSLAQKLLRCNTKNILSTLKTTIKESYDYIYNYEESKINVNIKFEEIKVESRIEMENLNKNNQYDIKGSNISDKFKIKQEEIQIDNDTLQYENINEDCAKMNFKCEDNVDPNHINTLNKINDTYIYNKDDDKLNIIIKGDSHRCSKKQESDVNINATNDLKMCNNKSKNKTVSLKNKIDSNKVDKQKISNILNSKTEISQTVKEELQEKFKIISLTEEELKTSREEKRSKHSYKQSSYKCDSCIIGFGREDKYVAHYIKNHSASVGVHQCDICQIRFKTFSRMSQHRQRHYVTHLCIMCKYETSLLKAAVTHSRTRHSGDTVGAIHCTQCDATAVTPEELAEHKRLEHTIFCSKCGERFKGEDTLRAHKRRIHNSKREFTCDICNKTFINKTRLESHIGTHDETLALKLAYCSQCQVQYKNLSIYRSHLKNSLSHMEKTHECKDCYKKFTSKVYLRKHQDFYHLGKSSFKCLICDKIFISDYQLKNHNQMHHGLTRPRNHGCNTCGKMFFTMATLRGHQLTHSESRSYMCEDCGDTFKQKPALYTHCRLVHKGYKRKK